MSCSRTQHGGGRYRTPDLSLRSPTLYHWATALPIVRRRMLIVPLSKQRIFIFHWLLEDMEERKCCVFKAFGYFRPTVYHNYKDNYFDLVQCIFISDKSTVSSVRKQRLGPMDSNNNQAINQNWFHFSWPFRILDIYDYGGKSP